MNDRGHDGRATGTRAFPGPFYECCKDGKGAWSIRDNRTGDAAVLNGRVQVGLDLDEADELAAILNRVEDKRAAERAARESGD